MKKIVPFILLIVFLGCIETSTGPGPLEPGLIGVWELKHTSGGISGGTIFPDGVNSFAISISAANQFVETKNDTVIYSGPIEVRYDSLYAKNIIDFIDSRRFSLIITQHSADSLILWDGFIDGYTSLYRKK
jgi:hypothetical protein